MTACVEHEILERFVAGTASGCECRQVVRHLLAGCGRCAALIRATFRPGIEAGAYDGAVDRWTTWARDRELAETRVLAALPKAGRREELIDV